MPRIAGVAVPKYSKHKASGQAVVTIGGIDHYLGPHGTKASLIEYDRLIAEWMANGRQLRITADAGLILAELIKRYREHVRQHYVKNGRPTSEQHDIACALRFVREQENWQAGIGAPHGDGKRIMVRRHGGTPKVDMELREVR